MESPVTPSRRSTTWGRWPARSDQAPRSNAPRPPLTVEAELVDVGDGSLVVEIAVRNRTSRLAVVWVGGSAIEASQVIEVRGNAAGTVVIDVTPGVLEVRTGGSDGDAIMVGEVPGPEGPAPEETQDEQWTPPPVPGS